MDLFRTEVKKEATHYTLSLCCPADSQEAIGRYLMKFFQELAGFYQTHP